MSAISGLHGWGWGRLLSPAQEGSGGNAPLTGAKLELTDEQIDALRAQSAKEAIDSLEGDFATGNLPNVEEVTFPGPIAEAFYWSNADVCGIQGPVGSGKTTTLMKSRLRRAIEMPRSTIDGVRRYKVLFIRETYRQLWSTSIPSYLETFPKELGKWSGGRGDPVTHIIHFEDEHGPIEFVAEFMAFGDDIVASMRGVQTTDIVLNESDTMPVEILTVGIGRIDRWPARQHFEGLPIHLRGYGQIVGDFNAPDEDNWYYRAAHDTESPDWEFFRQPGGVIDTGKLDQNGNRVWRPNLDAENLPNLPEGARQIEILFFNQPGYGQDGCENMQNLSPTYYQRQIATQRLAGRGDMVDRLVYNKVTYLRVGDPVWKREFNRRVHVSDTPLQPVHGVPLRVGLDQGFKGAAVIAQCLDDSLACLCRAAFSRRTPDGGRLWQPPRGSAG